MRPIAQRLPSVFTIRLWSLPAATDCTPPASTITGDVRIVVVPSPSWPDALQPIAQRLPSAFNT
ncbi:MAG TPA: hypothetical protein PKY24_02280, partial [Opitutaceae bacterium]|nr:hypothetical protein [Opitutaceae bacterium]